MNTNDIKDDIFSPWSIRIPVDDQVKSQVYNHNKVLYDIMSRQLVLYIYEQLKEDLND